MSPVVVHGEVISLLDELAAGDVLRCDGCSINFVSMTAPAASASGNGDSASAGFLSNFKTAQTSAFWNFVWHCSDIKVSLEFVLPGVSLHLSSARDADEHHNPGVVSAEGVAAAVAATAISSSESPDERNSFIPTISLVEFELESQKTRPLPQGHERIAESSRAPTKPLPVPSAAAKSSLEAPAKSLPPLPAAPAAAQRP